MAFLPFWEISKLNTLKPNLKCNMLLKDMLKNLDVKFKDLISRQFEMSQRFHNSNLSL